MSWLIENTIFACAVALLALLFERLWRTRPAACHVVWLTVLAVLVLPPIGLPSPVAVRGLFRPHIDELGQAAWARLERTDPGLGWSGESLFMPTEAPAASSPAVPAGSVKQEAFPPGFVLSPATSSRTSRAGAQDVAAVSWPGNLRDVIRLVWLGGAVCVLGVFLLRVRRVDRLVRRAGCTSHRVRARAAAIARELGVRPPEVRVARGLESPMVWGLGRPVLLWPAGLSVECQGGAGLLAHELAHLRRRDHWIAAANVFVSALMWWHPLARLALHRIDRYSEQACDAWAVSRGPRRAYAEALICIVERLSSRPRGGLAAGGQGSKALAERLGLVMRPDATPRCSRPIAVGAVVLLAFLLPTLSRSHALASLPVAPIDERLLDIAERAKLTHEADEWFDARAWGRAVEAYDLVLSKTPGDSIARARRAIALFQLGRAEQAEPELQAVLAEDGRQAELRFWLAGVHGAMGDIDAAKADFERAIALGLDFSERIRLEAAFAGLRRQPMLQDTLARADTLHRLRSEARAAMRAHDLEHAIPSLEELAKLCPEDGSTWHYLSYCNIAREHFEDAIEALDHQEALGHRLFVAAYNRACVLAIKGETDAAVAAFERSVDAGLSDYELAQTDPDLNSIRSDPRFKQALDRVVRPAKLLREIGVAEEFRDWQRVMELARTGAAFEAQRPEFEAERARAMAELGDAQGAAELQIELILSGLDPAEGFARLAQIEAAGGDDDGASAYLCAAAEAGLKDRDELADDARLAPLLDRPAFRHAAMGVIERSELKSFGADDWSELEARAQRTLENEPDAPEARHELGWALLRQGKIQQAEAEFRALVEADWRPAASSYNVACCLAQQGRSSEALDWLEKALAAGLDRPELIQSDANLAPLRDEVRFKKLVAQIAEGK